MIVRVIAAVTGIVVVGIAALGVATLVDPGVRKWVATRKGTADLMGAAGYQANNPAGVGEEYPTCPERARWVEERLRKYDVTLGDFREAAAKHDVPWRLLATVILNELADYGWSDELQEDRPPGLGYVFGKNYGISQLNLERARAHRPSSTNAELEDCLFAPRCSLDVAAAEVRALLDELEAQRTYFARELLQNPYPDSSGELDGEGARLLQRIYATSAAYNNPSIIRNWNERQHGHPHYVPGSAKDHPFGGSLIHAQNAVNLFAQCFLESDWPWERQIYGCTRFDDGCYCFTDPPPRRSLLESRGFGRQLTRNGVLYHLRIAPGTPPHCPSDGHQSPQRRRSLQPSR